MLQDVLKNYNTAEAKDHLVSLFSSSPSAQGRSKRFATRLNVQSGLSEASMYPQFSATPSQGVGLLLDLELPRIHCRTLQQFFNKLKRSFEANTGLKPPKILPPRRQIEEAWKLMPGPLKAKSVVVGSSISVHWCICDWLVYLHSTPALWSTRKFWTTTSQERQVSVVLRGDSLSMAGTSWTQPNCSILNLREHSRLLSGLWVVALAYKDDKDIEIIRPLWAEVLQVCNVVKTEVLARF